MNNMSETAAEPLAHPTASAPTAAPRIEKLVVKVRYPLSTSENEYRFRVKETDTIGRVLAAVCYHSGLSVNQYVSHHCHHSTR
jgi:hypothetical protein